MNRTSKKTLKISYIQQLSLYESMMVYFEAGLFTMLLFYVSYVLQRWVYEPMQRTISKETKHDLSFMILLCCRPPPTFMKAIVNIKTTLVSYLEWLNAEHLTIDVSKFPPAPMCLN